MARLHDPHIVTVHDVGEVDGVPFYAMRYVAGVAAQMGVRSEIRTVLSMPLGASEVTIEEMTALYEGLTTGWTL